MKWRNVFWWTGFIFCAVALQSLMPGLDFLLPGILLSLQERRHEQTFILCVSFILLQEGMGSIAFGSTLLLYSIAVLLYSCGCSLFHGRSFLFMVLLGAALSPVRFLISRLMAELQFIPWEEESLIDVCLVQAALTPAVCFAASRLRRRCLIEAGKSK